eukprot:4283086-Pleurochrysis_carterae.AAC.2
MACVDYGVRRNYSMPSPPGVSVFNHSAVAPACRARPRRWRRAASPPPRPRPRSHAAARRTACTPLAPGPSVDEAARQ